jgi:hypothetical protein
MMAMSKICKDLNLQAQFLSRTTTSKVSTSLKLLLLEALLLDVSSLQNVEKQTLLNDKVNIKELCQDVLLLPHD